MQVKGCVSSNDVWKKLESIYASKGPARKASLLKRLTQQKMKDGDDLKQHLAEFFDAVDKLESMEVKIHGDLLSIMLLYSLPSTFENFRCAIESRDTLPDTETLKIKIVEEYNARLRKSETYDSSAAMFAKPNPKFSNKGKVDNRDNETGNSGYQNKDDNTFKRKPKYKCGF